MNRSLRSALCIASMLPVLVADRNAGAQTRSDPAAARALFMEGRQLMAEKKFDQACPKFEESQKLDPGIGTLFNLADCWERVGRTASAWARFLDVASAARLAGQADREKVARDRAGKLEPKLSRLTIQVTNAVTGERVSKDGIEIGNAEWGTAVPTDPGEHTVEATAPGKKAWRSTTRLAGAGAKATVTVPGLDDDVQAALAATTPVATNPPPETTAPVVDSGLTKEQAEKPSTGSTQRTIGYVVGAVGIVGLGVGTFFGIQYLSKNGDAKKLCTLPNNTCPNSDEEAQHEKLVGEAKDAQTPAIIGLAAGGALVATGLVLILTAPKGGTTTGLQIAPIVSATEGGLRLNGTF